MISDDLNKLTEATNNFGVILGESTGLLKLISEMTRILNLPKPKSKYHS